MPHIPSATYRVQFNRQFTFAGARDIISYLNDLGISDIYASPYFKAKAGSLHGYDIVDHEALNPEIGGDEQYHDFAAALKRHDMGQVLDIVPNHMGIGKENPWWNDLLENGPSSVYAAYFDIIWNPVKKDLKNRVLIPVLGDQYGTVLENRELKLKMDNGAFFVHYDEYIFPVLPQTYSLILKFRLPEMEETISGDDPALTELLSILTALDHLPPYTETDPEKIRECYREKEIIKHRIADLYGRSSPVREFIDRNILLFNGTQGEPESFDLLDRLLGEQAYRLSHWRVATEEINYRRFFDINELAAIRVENPAVFRQTHQLIFKLIRDGSVRGLRVDHPDGLYNPSEYFRWLQRNCLLQVKLGIAGDAPDDGSRKGLVNADGGGRAHSDSQTFEQETFGQYEEMLLADPGFKPFYIVGEKILLKGERIPDDWQIFSTTGYVFMNSVNGIFVETENAKAFDDIYAWFTKTRSSFTDIVYNKKKLIMEVAMSSEVNMLGHYLNEIAEVNRHTRDFTLNSLTRAIKEVIAFFPVYRTYIYHADVAERDRRYIEHAVGKAKRNNPAINESVFNFLRVVLLLEYPDRLSENEKKKWLDFVMRFQQITGPVMAKGAEDTAFYIYNRLASLNDVGGSPDRFGTPLETFHGQNIERMKSWPHALITTSTHDTKRGEDTRARINVLSEIPDTWKQCLIHWRRLNKKQKIVVDGRSVPDHNEEYLLYQTLIGVWPVQESGHDEYQFLRERVIGYIIKAAREAKVNTSWINPNPAYEDALKLFLDRILRREPRNQFLENLTSFQERISHLGMFTSLSQTLLKITSPGVPDFYQGTEVWDFSLVDPDNRRPVDYAMRIKMMGDLRKRLSGIPRQELALDLTEHKEDGAIKMYLIQTALSFRRDNAELFKNGEYQPIDVMGNKAEHVCAFLRRTGSRSALVAVPRFFSRLIHDTSGLPLGRHVWEDSFLVIPNADAGSEYRHIFTGQMMTTVDLKGASGLYLSDVFEQFPVALLDRVG
ncbi:MAG: malto-oligosyltrehalose synthase [Nitrospirae bacterium]|nr:malto-oligosyltrehalose synthase [Nitrospirota bacterium]